MPPSQHLRPHIAAYCLRRQLEVFRNHKRGRGKYAKRAQKPEEDDLQVALPGPVPVWTGGDSQSDAKNLDNSRVSFGESARRQDHCSD
jgi:hypothetical protein